MTADSMIDYEALAQEAMRSVVRTVLTDAAVKGLPGDHHFYISFDTLAPGVILSKRLREKYAEEMTIVLQHRFWDLIINDHRFEVKLTFDGIPERLVVPFKAIRVFFDPSVRYGLQFESVADAMDLASAEDGSPRAFDDPYGERSAEPTPTAPRAEGPLSSARSEPARIGRPLAGAGPTPVTKPKLRPRDTARAKDKADDKEHPADKQGLMPPAAAEQSARVAENNGAEIVSLDAFRKK